MNAVNVSESIKLAFPGLETTAFGPATVERRIYLKLLSMLSQLVLPMHSHYCPTNDDSRDLTAAVVKVYLVEDSLPLTERKVVGASSREFPPFGLGFREN